MTTRVRVGRGRRSAGSRRGGPRRGVFWDDTMVDTTLANNGVSLPNLDGGIPEDEIKGLTVTRILLDLWCQAVTVNTSGLLSFGIYVVENDALSAGAVAEPQDSVDDAGWMFRLARQAWGSSNLFDHAQALHVVADLRAQRKYPGEDYTLLGQWVNHEASGSVNVDGIVRTLYKRA